MKKNTRLTTPVKGIDWTFIMQSDAVYARSHGVHSKSEACTYSWDKEVYFKRGTFTPSVVRHEIIHVIVASAGVNSADLTADQMEELIAELYETHGPEMDVLVDKILEHFLR